MTKLKKPELGNSNDQPERSTKDDRYSSWRDGRYESKGMKRRLADFRFNSKHFYWPIVKKYANKAFPWPLGLFLFLSFLVDLFRKILI